MNKHDYIFYKTLLEEDNLKVYDDLNELSIAFLIFLEIEISVEELERLENED